MDVVVSDAAVIDAEFELVGNAVVVEGGAVEIIKIIEKIRLIKKYLLRAETIGSINFVDCFCLHFYCKFWLISVNNRRS